MADAVVSVVINAEDNASAAIGRVAQSLGALNAQGGNANIQTGKVNKGIKSIGDASEKASNQAKTLDKELTGLSKQSASIPAQRISGGIKSIGDASEKASNQAKTLDKELTSGSNAINKFNTIFTSGKSGS